MNVIIQMGKTDVQTHLVQVHIADKNLNLNLHKHYGLCLYRLLLLASPLLVGGRLYSKIVARK